MSENRHIPTLDAHGQQIMEQYRAMLPVYTQMAQKIPGRIRQFLEDAGIVVAAIECRVKTEKSLAGKLELKGTKYRDLFDLTDILGLRVITFYIDDVDKVASVLERLFEIDWENSVDKRKVHEIDSFGYLSLHYICRIPESAYSDLQHPELNKIRFEVQMRTVLQHAWASMNHDTGYKSGVEVPKEYLRSMSRLAGMLELADEQFSHIRTEINNYRRRVQGLVASGRLEEVELDGDTFRSYLELRPFDKLNRRIAAVNQAEIQEVSLMNYLTVFKGLGCKTLGSIAAMVRDHSDAAYQIACYQIGLTDLDIISSSLGPQDLCIAFVLKSGGGKAALKYLLDLMNGPAEGNDMMAEMLLEQAQDLPFMHQ